MNVFEVERGTSPVILSFPHTGMDLPDTVMGCLNENGRLLADTDWHIHTLYKDLLPDATTVRATFHRYVIDANRDPAGGSLYPGLNTTDLVPRTDFDGNPIWRKEHEPTAADIAARVVEFHAPYHFALAGEIKRIKAMHGIAVLYDCHSIRSRIPFLFEGILPDFNVGTDDGRTCSPLIESAIVEIAGSATGYTSVSNGRFKGGWTTRHYGQPGQGTHAIQMELAQSTYLFSETLPFAYDTAKATAVRTHLKAIVERIEQIALRLKPGEHSP